MAVLLGVHASNLHLTLAQRWPATFDIDVAYVPYASGKSTASRLQAGDIDIGGTGSTPAVAAQVQGLPVRYVAASAPRPANGALLVPAGSPLHHVHHLAGRRIALVEGSFHTYLLARLLDEAGLTLRDVHRINLPPADSLAALQDGTVDAWVAMAPHLGAARAAAAVTTLAPCGLLIPNRSMFWTLTTRPLDASVDAAFVAGLDALGARITADPERAAHLLSSHGVGQASHATWLDAVRSRDWRVEAAGPLLLAEQRDEADTLIRHGALVAGTPAPAS